MSASPTPHILYLHGFNSSPESHKARVLAEHMHAAGLASQLTVADIPSRPTFAETYLDVMCLRLMEANRLCVVGSSLGGFYATWLAERHGLDAVLINPAVRPHLRLREFIGTNENFHTGESWEFTSQDVDTLERMYRPSLADPGRYRVLLQTGDETLDYRDAETYYAGSDMLIETGGDHSFSGFASHLDDILQRCGFSSRM